MDVFQARDGFVGSAIGVYLTREGEPGLVLQQVGSKVVHVYRATVLERRAPPPPAIIIAEETAEH